MNDAWIHETDNLKEIISEVEIKSEQITTDKKYMNFLKIIIENKFYQIFQFY